MQRSVGIFLTGDTSAQYFWYFYGTGANGKSVFIRVLELLLGQYSGRLPSDLLIQKKSSEHPTGLAKLHGLRLGLAPELPSGGTFNETMLKEATGGDRLTARRMREDFWDFQSQAKICISGNQLLRIKAGNHGIWRRVLLVPFAVTIPESQRDPDLIHKLTAELSGILNWAIEGCLAWQRDGLSPPAAVLQAVDDYRDDEDAVREFLDVCTVKKASERINNGTLFRVYTAFCEVTGEHAASKRTLLDMLQEKGFKSGKSGSTRCRIGLELHDKLRRAVADEHDNFLTNAIRSLVKDSDGAENSITRPTNSPDHDEDVEKHIPCSGDAPEAAGRGTDGTHGTQGSCLSLLESHSDPQVPTQQGDGVPCVPRVPELPPPPTGIPDTPRTPPSQRLPEKVGSRKTTGSERASTKVLEIGRPEVQS